MTSRGSLQGVDAWIELGRDPPNRSPFPALIYGCRRVTFSPLPLPTHACRGISLVRSFVYRARSLLFTFLSLHFLTSEVIARVPESHRHCLSVRVRHSSSICSVSGPPRSRCEPPCERAPRSRAWPPSQCRDHRCLRQRASATAPLVRSRAGVWPRPVRRRSVRRRRSVSRSFLAACWVRAGPDSPVQCGRWLTRGLRAPWQALRSICRARAGAWNQWRWARAPGERAGSGNIWSRRENGSSEHRLRLRRRTCARPSPCATASSPSCALHPH